MNDPTFDVDDTDCQVPPIPRSNVSSRHLQYYPNSHLVLNNYTSFAQMLSFYIYICPYLISPTCSSYHDTLEFSSTLHHINMETAEYWLMARGIWHLGMPPLLHCSSGQKTLTQSPLEKLPNVSTIISFGPQPATPYASYLKKLYLDASFWH